MGRFDFQRMEEVLEDKQLCNHIWAESQMKETKMRWVVHRVDQLLDMKVLAPPSDPLFHTARLALDAVKAGIEKAAG